MLKKTTFREIKNSLGRYIAIVAIVALGIGFFAGLKITKFDMISTANDYLKENHFFDYQLISTLGFEDEDVINISQVDNVAYAEGSISSDILYSVPGEADKVTKAMSIPEKVNTLKMVDGRMPQADNECLADNNAFDKSDIGETIILSDANSTDTKGNFKYTQYTIVGICESPLYMNFERGNSSLGNGSISCYIFLPKDSFNIDYYTEMYVDLNNDDEIFSQEYDSYIADMESSMTEACDASAARRYEKVVSDATAKLDDAKAQYDSGYSEFLAEKKAAYDKLDSAYAKLSTAEADIEKNQADLDNQKKSLTTSKSSLEAGLSDVAIQRQTLEAAQGSMSPEDYAAAKAKLDGTEAALAANLNQVNSGLSRVEAGQAKLDEGRKEIAYNMAEYLNGKAEADSQFASAEAQLDKAKADIADGENELSKLSQPKTYVLNRDTNIGYVSFENDSGLIDGIAKVFPVFFFLVAALVCMTTMTRMVDEQRTQIGVFKALGYGNGAVIGEYLFYSGSAATIGMIIGFFGGSYLFPKVIWSAYGMLYDFDSTLNYIFDWKLGTLSLLAALVCSMGSTLFSCLNDFRIVPAELIRPKAPKNGKRIFLERITPLWKKVSFLYKVTLRNIFRYKKRFFMMVLGISGCTALLVTGFGVNDSIKNIVEFQYDEIMTYDYSVTFDEAVSPTAQDDFDKESSQYTVGTYFMSETTMEFVKDSQTKSIRLMVSDGKGIGDFIDLHTDSKVLEYPGKGEAIICNEIADRYDVSVGDTITVRNSSRDEMKVKVIGICENYIYDYIYVTPETYEAGFGEPAEYKTALVKAADNSPEGVKLSSSKIQEMDNVMGTFVNNDMKDRVNQMMESLDAVILLVIMSAGALAFIVLYNLTNINITERIREIATIKVLGFYPNETSAYVFRENFILTGISAVVGLILGKWLHAFVMSQLKIDLISFDVRITTLSYVLSVVLTFVFAIIVSVFMYFKLQKVSMTESLKSIE